MFHLSADNAAEYLAGRGITPICVNELGGGVSNTVLLVESAAARLVLKQSLGKLRVEQDWFADRERIFRESGALRSLARSFPPGALPEVLFEDRPHCLFAMTAAPAGARTWKSLLMEGDVDAGVSAQIGGMLAALARASWRDPAAEAAYGDQTVFDQLRLDPYYRSTARCHPDLAPHFTRLIAMARTRRACLVHGDWSPKNFLVSLAGVMAIDFEVIHFGDPGFDAAFLLNHLLLKSFHLPRWRAKLAGAAARFWEAYRDGLPPDADWIEAATIAHLGGLLLARIDGKSPAEYIREPDERERIRAFARGLILSPPAAVEEVFARS